MKGADGNPEAATHTTRVFDRGEYVDANGDGTTSDAEDAWRWHVLACGISPPLVTERVVDENGAVTMKTSRKWPAAMAVCTCGWSRGAVSRVMARSCAFVHREASR